MTKTQQNYLNFNINYENRKYRNKKTDKKYTLPGYIYIFFFAYSALH